MFYKKERGTALFYVAVSLFFIRQLMRLFSGITKNRRGNTGSLAFEGVYGVLGVQLGILRAAVRRACFLSEVSANSTMNAQFPPQPQPQPQSEVISGGKMGREKKPSQTSEANSSQGGILQKP